VLVKDIGICLARREYSETSQIVTFFTRDHGKIRGIAKGARRAKSKFGGGIEPLSRGQLIFSPGRGKGLLSLTEWTAQENHLALRRDLQQLYRGYYLAELVDLFTEEMDRHEQLYDCFCQTLADLSSGRGWAEFLGFQVRLLEEVGLSPEMWNCVHCRKSSQGMAVGYMSFSEGGILCRGCAGGVLEKERIAPAGLKIVRQFSSHALSKRANEPTSEQPEPTGTALKDAHARQAQDLLEYWIRAALNREPKTAHLLR